MHSQSDTLKILGCSKMTLSRYVREGKLNRIKKGRYTYYDEHEVAALVLSIEDGKKKAGIPVKEKEPIPLPEDVAKDVRNISFNKDLDAVGMQYLSEASAWLNDAGLYEECDKHMLLNYALHAMMWHRYIVLSLENDCIAVNASGTMQVHPYHKVAEYHERQMMQCADRLGLHPKARQKLVSIEKDDIDEMEQLIG